MVGTDGQSLPLTGGSQPSGMAPAANAAATGVLQGVRQTDGEVPEAGTGR